MKPSKRNLHRQAVERAKRREGPPAVSKYAEKNGRCAAPKVPDRDIRNGAQQLAAYFNGDDQ